LNTDPSIVWARRRQHSADSDAGGTGIVLRFGWFYGRGATHNEQLLALARRHICVQMGRADGYVSSIHVADGGAAVAAALHAPAGTFNVVDDEPLTKRDYAEALARQHVPAPGFVPRAEQPSCSGTIPHRSPARSG
jgi:nucleoside-diphosphate-sugar epimerase